jgi:Domain of unknown function (DU1801)
MEKECYMESENVKRKIESYPTVARVFADDIRNLIYETAKQENLGNIEESIKWGEPSFKAANGSPIRIDWKLNTPDKFYIFFNCRTILVETFREIYSSALKFEGNRAIVLELSEEIPKNILQHCISLALNYHKIKNIPLLGV